MTFWNWLTRKRDDHGWPGYIINGRIRTSTVALIVAFNVIAWLHFTYQPAPSTPTAPETAQVVPPGFVPDPEYTWVPRTNVQERPRTTTTTPTTTTTTTEPSPTETTPTSPTTPTIGEPTTVVGPDGSGTLPPQTLTPATTPVAPNTVTSAIPGPGPVATTPAPTT